MSVEYDLVVIGSTQEGIVAAVTAAALKARVALVEQPFQGSLGNLEAIYYRTFNHLVRLSDRWSTAVEIGAYQPTFDLEIQLTQVAAWAQEAIAILAEQNSPAILASKGIDVIRGAGEFCRLPHQAFIVGNRKLRSRNYLIATGSHLVTPAIDGLEKVDYLSPSDLWQGDKLASLPEYLTVIGKSSLAIQLAQNLRKTGRNISLLVEDRHLLAREDPEIAYLLQAQLEASGVEIFLESPVSQIRKIEAKQWLQAGNRAIETDAILLVGQQQPNLEGLNLEGVGVRIEPWGIPVNEKLQTTNPRIYACGSVIGGYPLMHIARYEAEIAVKNALFLPLLSVNYQTIPYVILANPSIARVGMTEAQARKRYGEDISTVKQNFKAIALAQLLGETTGFCKFVVRRNGEILGAHIVGAQAGEFVSAIALAMQHKIKLNAIANLICPSFTFSEILRQTALDWNRQRFENNKSLQKFLENLSIWLRNIAT
jgi:pyruvate/2-oxoglutarate dehydrogenase complex dihydrolipoamide dehydrogenase (E3) component